MSKPQVRVGLLRRQGVPDGRVRVRPRRLLLAHQDDHVGHLRQWAAEEAAGLEGGGGGIGVRHPQHRRCVAQGTGMSLVAMVENNRLTSCVCFGILTSNSRKLNSNRLAKVTKLIPTKEVAGNSYARLGLDDASYRAEIGWRVKRILDEGRVRYAKGVLGLKRARLVHYCPKDVSPENVLLIASK